LHPTSHGVATHAHLKHYWLEQAGRLEMTATA
jgi:hypothetical protein